MKKYIANRKLKAKLSKSTKKLKSKSAKKSKSKSKTKTKPKPKTMTTFEGTLQSPYYEYVRDGKKIYEMRVNDDKRRKMNIGDKWKFTHATDETLPQFETQIMDKKIYKSFEDAIDETGFEKLLPNAKSKEEAIKIYNAFNNGHYEIDAKKYGVVRFTLKVIVD